MTYVDDLVVFISVRFSEILSGIMQTAPIQVINYLGQDGLNLRANPPFKNELVLFTTEHKMPSFSLFERSWELIGPKWSTGSA